MPLRASKERHVGHRRTIVETTFCEREEPRRIRSQKGLVYERSFIKKHHTRSLRKNRTRLLYENRAIRSRGGEKHIGGIGTGDVRMLHRDGTAYVKMLQ